MSLFVVVLVSEYRGIFECLTGILGRVAMGDKSDEPSAVLLLSRDDFECPNARRGTLDGSDGDK